jgi:hypothetical protein
MYSSLAANYLVTAFLLSSCSTGTSVVPVIRDVGVSDIFRTSPAIKFAICRQAATDERARLPQ